MSVVVFVLFPGNEQVENACSSGGIVLSQYPLDALLELRDSGVRVLAAVNAPKAQLSDFGDDRLLGCGLSCEAHIRHGVVKNVSQLGKRW